MSMCREEIGRERERERETERETGDIRYIHTCMNMDYKADVYSLPAPLHVCFICASICSDLLPVGFAYSSTFCCSPLDQYGSHGTGPASGQVGWGGQSGF